jgi:hypothetical protein
MRNKRLELRLSNILYNRIFSYCATRTLPHSLPSRADHPRRACLLGRLEINVIGLCLEVTIRVRERGLGVRASRDDTASGEDGVDGFQRESLGFYGL